MYSQCVSLPPEATTSTAFCILFSFEVILSLMNCWLWITAANKNLCRDLWRARRRALWASAPKVPARYRSALRSQASIPKPNGLPIQSPLIFSSSSSAAFLQPQNRRIFIDRYWVISTIFGAVAKPKQKIDLNQRESIAIESKQNFFIARRRKQIKLLMKTDLENKHTFPLISCQLIVHNFWNWYPRKN